MYERYLGSGKKKTPDKKDHIIHNLRSPSNLRTWLEHPYQDTTTIINNNNSTQISNESSGGGRQPHLDGAIHCVFRSPSLILVLFLCLEKNRRRRNDVVVVWFFVVADPSMSLYVSKYCTAASFQHFAFLYSSIAGSLLIIACNNASRSRPTGISSRYRW